MSCPNENPILFTNSTVSFYLIEKKSMDMFVKSLRNSNYEISDNLSELVSNANILKSTNEIIFPNLSSQSN